MSGLKTNYERNRIYALYIKIVADRNKHRSITSTFDSTARCTDDGTLEAPAEGDATIGGSGGIQ